MSQTTVSEPLISLRKTFEPLRVMLIENSMADAELNLHELQRAGFQCRPQIIGTRAEFLDQLSRFPYDVVLADYRLPGWTGIEAYKAMREGGAKCRSFWSPGRWARRWRSSASSRGLPILF